MQSAETPPNDVLAIVLEQTRRLGRSLDAAAIDREARLPEDLLPRLGELGLFGLTIPATEGGLGLSLGNACQVVAELAEVDRSVATTVGLHCGLGTRGLVELGEGALRRRWLARLASGEVVAAFCATEPGAGSDLTAVATTAHVEGDALRLEGEKAYVTNGGFAGMFTVLARTPDLGGNRAWSLLAVPRDRPGVHVGAEEHKLGIRGTSTTTVRFDGVRLPRNHVLGEPGAGMPHAHRLLEWGRTLMAAGCVGTARTALRATLAHAKGRRQFGRPLADLQVVEGHLARMASTAWAMEALVAHVGRLEGAGRPIAVPSAAAKVFCSEGAFDICDRAVQLHGALGFVEDTGVALLLRDCRVTRIFEGANDVLCVRIGTALATGAPGTERLVHCAGSVDLEPHREWTTANARLDALLDEARRRKGIALIRDQRWLAWIGQAHVALHAASASLAAAGPGANASTRGAHACKTLVHRAHDALDCATHAPADAARDAALMEVLR